MGKAVLISIRPKWCGKIVSGEKTVELRTNRPWTYRPAKVYIYCTKDRHLTFYRGKRYCYADDHAHNAFDIPCNGAIIGEFTCDDANFTRIVRIGDGVYPPKYCMCLPGGNVAPPDKIFDDACLTREEADAYLGGREGWAWRISGLRIYDQPRAPSDFTGLRDTRFGAAPYGVKRPPQSWCYVEVMDDAN